jgi:hypothetical protein
VSDVRGETSDDVLMLETCSFCRRRRSEQDEGIPSLRMTGHLSIGRPGGNRMLKQVD